LDTEEKNLLGIIEIQKTQKPSYTLHINNVKFPLENTIITRESTPVTRPTTRGGVYFSGKFEYKIKAQVNDSKIIPLLSKCMLGPNTEFEELKITTKLQFENSLKQVTFVANLTNCMQSSSHIELNLIIIRSQIENSS
jgi:hypothetical protein